MPYKDPIKERLEVNRRKRRYRADTREFIRGYLEAHPCIDCGEADPIVLEFDHRDPQEKKIKISRARHQNLNVPDLLKELEKCDVRCANCHRRRTHQQRMNGEFKATLRREEVTELQMLLL